MKLKDIVANIAAYGRSKALQLRLRPGQHDVFEALYQFLKTGQKSGYLKLPSGVGKTNLALELMIAGKFPKVLFLVPRLVLIEQTVKRFKKFSNVEVIGTYYGTKKNLDAPVVVASYQSFQKMAQFQTKLHQFDLVIWDEVHEALSEKRKMIMNMFSPDTIHLGLTASDEWNEGKKVTDFIPRIYDMEIAEAIKLELLCGVRCWLATTDIDLSEIKIVAGDYDLETQARIIDIKRRNQAAAEIYLQHLYGQTCLITAINIEHAIRVAEMFQQAGISAAAVWGGTKKHPLSQKEIRQRLEDWRNGLIKVMVTVDLVDKGFDNTLVSALINLRITSSVVKATQRGGRVLRLFYGNDGEQPIVAKMKEVYGGKLATVVDFLDDFGNHGFRPILFSDILKGSFALPPYMEEKTTRQITHQDEPPQYLWPADETDRVRIQLVTDLTEVARITKDITTFDHIPVANDDGVAFIEV